MRYDKTNDGFVNLANAIILLTIKDYLQNKISEYGFKHFLYSEWYSVLTDLEPQVIYDYALELKEDNIKKKQFFRMSKEDYNV